MCGICGLAAPSDVTTYDEVTRMVGALAHRGPGDRRVGAAGGLLLGSARLHVTDPDAPSGPYASADGLVTAVVNGEIWNHEALRAELERRGVHVPRGPDTAVVAPLYAAEGLEGLRRLEGMFAIALHDARDGSVVLARDRFGIKPLYYRPGPPLRFASEAAALAAGGLGGGGGLDHDALSDYLALGFVPAPRTLDRDVRKVPAGHVLVFGPSGGAPRAARLRALPAAEEGADVTPGEILRVLERAVGRHLMGDAPIGVYLSGGLDSAAVSALVRRHGAPLRTFALTFPGEGVYDEGAAAARTAADLGAAHRAVAMIPADVPALLPRLARSFGEPFGDPSALAVLALSRIAAQDVTVVLTGTGADELFAGYRRYAAGRFPTAGAPLARLAAAALPRSRRTRLGTLGALAAKLARSAAADPATRYFRTLEVVPAAWRGRLLGSAVRDPVPPPLRAAFASGVPFEDAARAADLALYLPDDLLAKEDRATMAASLENRVPFLDDAVADLAGRIPGRRHGLPGLRGDGKRLLRRALRDVLPAEVLTRRKHGFAVPVAEWLRGPLRGLVDDHLVSADARIRRLLEASALDSLVQHHRAGDDDLGLAVYALVALEAALRVDTPGA